jgi:hypothetical protein
MSEMGYFFVVYTLGFASGSVFVVALAAVLAGLNNDKCEVYQNE